MEIHHGLHPVQIFGLQFLEKEHAGIADDDIRQEPFFLRAPVEQGICGIRHRQVLKMGDDLYRKPATQHLRRGIQFLLPVADQYQIVSPGRQLPGIFQAHTRTSTGDQCLHGSVN